MKNENRDKIAAWVKKRVDPIDKPRLFVQTCANIEGSLETIKEGLAEANIPWDEDEALDLYLLEMEEVVCAVCGMPASELYDEIPEVCYMAAKWYCSEDCYEEDTKHEG